MNCSLVIPGCFYIKQALSQQEQVELAKLSKDWEKKLLPSTTTRNRVYDAISKFSDAEHLLVLCRKLLTEANKIDKQIMEPMTERN